MKIIIGGSKGGGWSNYVLYGTKSKPRNMDLIELLDGNLSIGENVTAQANWVENEYHIILGFKGKPPRNIVRKVLNIFKRYFMAGFAKEEYHFDAIAHFDTDDTHIHIRIPKMNLLTSTQLQLYWHAKDYHRINLIRDHINYKFNLDISVNEKPLLQESQKIVRIKKWKKEGIKKEFSFKTKKSKEHVRASIENSIMIHHHEGNINSFEQLEIFLIEFYPEYPVVNNGYDIPKKFHYFTIIDGYGEKLRLRGEIYSKDFWKKPREERIEQFMNNTSESKEISQSKDVLVELEIVTKNRIKDINKRYRRARAKANQEQGREQTRAYKYNKKISQENNENDELSRAENTIIRTRARRGEATSKRGENSIQERTSKIVRECFRMDTTGSKETSENRVVVNLDKVSRRVRKFIKGVENWRGQSSTRIIELRGKHEKIGENFSSKIKNRVDLREEFMKIGKEDYDENNDIFSILKK